MERCGCSGVSVTDVTCSQLCTAVMVPVRSYLRWKCHKGQHCCYCCAVDKTPIFRPFQARAGRGCCQALAFVYLPRRIAGGRRLIINRRARRDSWVVRPANERSTSMERVRSMRLVESSKVEKLWSGEEGDANRALQQRSCLEWAYQSRISKEANSKMVLCYKIGERLLWERSSRSSTKAVWVRKEK